MASLNFEELVRAAIIEGATRADAEARAREILFGDGDSDVRFLNDMDEALWQSCSRLEFENHWREMERVMKATGGGAEVILESMTELLDAGSISESQYEELLSRAWASGSSQADDVEQAAWNDPERRHRRLQRLETGEARVATRLQAAIRRMLARRSFKTAVIVAHARHAEAQARRERAAIAVQAARRRMIARSLAASARLALLQQQKVDAAANLQQAARALLARRRLQACRAAAVKLQSVARRLRAKDAAAQERDARLKAEAAEAKAAAEAEAARLKAEAEAKAAAEAEAARLKAEAEAKAAAEAEAARLKAEAEAKATAEAEAARLKAEAEAKATAEAEAAASKLAVEKAAAERRLEKAVASRAAAFSAATASAAPEPEKKASTPPTEDVEAPQLVDRWATATRSAAVTALTSDMVRARAVAELDQAQLGAGSRNGGTHPRGPPQVASNSTSRLLPSLQQRQHDLTRGSSAAPLGRHLRPVSEAKVWDPTAGAWRSKLSRTIKSASAGGLGGGLGLGSVLSDLDSLKENMIERRASAAAAAKTLQGAAPWGGAASSGGGGGKGSTLRWHGTRSFLERTKGNR